MTCRSAHETELQLPPGASFSKWWLSEGRVLAQERLNRHVHLFTAAGQTIDLSETLMSVPLQSSVVPVSAS